jgi:hypothetical protein
VESGSDREGRERYIERMRANRRRIERLSAMGVIEVSHATRLLIELDRSIFREECRVAEVGR